MYGLVNQAVQDLVCSKFGEETWDRIKEQAGVETELFVSMDAYPDDITYNLVAAASDILDIPPEEVLRAFGQYWVLYTAREGYGDLFTMWGSSLPEFLINLDNMHARVSLSLTNLAPPSFVCRDIQPNSLILQYHSHRQGLAPMVVGLLEGLGQMFNTPITIEQRLSRDQGHDHDEFYITFATTH